MLHSHLTCVQRSICRTYFDVSWSREVRSWTGVECFCHHWCGSWATGIFLCWVRHVAMDIGRCDEVVWCGTFGSIHVSWTESRAVHAVDNESRQLLSVVAIIERSRVLSLSMKGWHVCTQVLNAFLRVSFIVLSHWSCLRMILTWRLYILSNTFVTFPCSVTSQETWRERDDIMIFFLCFSCVFFVFCVCLCVYFCFFFVCVFLFFFRRFVF